MATKTKGESANPNWGQTIVDSTRQIWLAGLGAFARAQTEGNKMFDTLVKEGQAVEGRTKHIATEQMTQIGKKASGAWDKLEQVFEERVSRSLNRLGVPTYKDIDALTKQVGSLNDSVQQLLNGAKPKSTGSRTRKSAKGSQPSAMS
jgi:poly(hydroxyalkanoate) granule-associated protein